MSDSCSLAVGVMVRTLWSFRTTLIAQYERYACCVCLSNGYEKNVGFATDIGGCGIWVINANISDHLR